jgi:hypothetical protein
MQAVVPAPRFARPAQREIGSAFALPSLWDMFSDSWQRMADRKVAHAVQGIEHPGVTEDFRAARG